LLLLKVDRIRLTLSYRKSRSIVQRLGVTVQTKTMVTTVEDNLVTARDDKIEEIPAEPSWAAGVKASPLGAVLAKRGRSNLTEWGESSSSLTKCTRASQYFL